jgi:methionyl-tRNA formyltransferase
LVIIVGINFTKIKLNTAETIKSRIVFFGTPDFAVASLDALLLAGANILAVVTSLDKPNNRGSISNGSAVKQYALSHNIPILQPVSMKSPEFIKELSDFNANLFVVVAFRMMPEIVWNMPEMGTINLHGSLLPAYRGAAPINWAIINGEKETGVTTFKLKQVVDTGDILLQKNVPILDSDNAETLHDKLMNVGADLLVETVIGLYEGSLKEIPQKDVETTYASKLFKENTIIDWNNTVYAINNFIRGLSPYPCAYIYLGKKLLKIQVTNYITEIHNKPIGTLDTDNKTYLRFACLDGWTYIDELQLEGKKRMRIFDFLMGHKL